MIQEMYAEIQKQTDKHSVSELCSIYSISRSGYYKWLERAGQLNRFEKTNQILDSYVLDIHNHPMMGYRQIRDKLCLEFGWVVSDPAVWKSMKRLGIHGFTRHRKAAPTGSNLEHIRYANVLNRKFKAEKPLQKIVTDVTYIKHNGKWYYLAGYLDLFNNEILEWELSDTLKKKSDFVFSDEQIIAILKSNNRAADIAMILISTGCRPIDLFTAELNNCYDTYFISGSKTEAGRDRVIPVNEIGQQSYNKIKQSAKSNGGSLLIDGYSRNKRYKNFAKRDWKELMEELKIDGVVPYDCRHTYATLAVKSNVQPEVLQKILGHASYNTTIKHYTRLDKDFVLEGSKQLTITATLQPHKNESSETREKSSGK